MEPKTLSFEPNPLVCCRKIEIELTDGLISRVRFVGGCPGNTLGLTKLLTGMEPAKAIELLKGVRCGAKPTSCPDQLAIALESMLG